jgi:large subunit ribosomal protein L1
MAIQSKRLRDGAKTIDLQKIFTFQEAVELIRKFPSVKFDESVELHFHLGTDPKNTEQIVRGTLSLPHGLGKVVRVAVFCKGEQEILAKNAGADYVGSDDLIAKVQGGFLDFDVVVATPDMMRDLSKLGKVLGPRGLMPTPKAGTVTTDVAKAVVEVKAGKIEFKSDKQSGIHVAIGKKSFSEEKIMENGNKVIEAIKAAKPVSVKGIYIKNISISTTMGVGLKVAI